MRQMNPTTKLYFQTANSFLYYDQGLLPTKEQLMPFAYTDVFTEFAGNYQHPFIHYWQLQNTVILGMKDTRLPKFQKAVTFLRTQGYQVILRNSGGLSVIADQETLNVSLILPNSKNKPINIDIAYEFMADWMGQAFPTSYVEEVPDSYCPGTFDLCIDGKKLQELLSAESNLGLLL